MFQRWTNKIAHRLLSALTLLLLLSGCAGMQARRQHDEYFAQHFSLDRQLHEQYRQGKISYTDATAKLIELSDRLIPSKSRLEDVRLYRLDLAEQVDNGELDLATAKDLFRAQFINAIAEANPATRYSQIRVSRLMLEVVSALDHPRPVSDYTFHIIPKGRVNAGSAGGGVFYIWSGALDLSDRQLMALLAHEVAHDSLNHRLKNQVLDFIMVLGVAAINLKSPLAASIADQVRVPIFMAFSRSEEADADAEAVRLLQRLGYSKMELAALFEEFLTRYGNTGGSFLATHPLTTDRIAAVRALPEDLTWAGPRRAASAKARGFLGITTREIAPEEAKFYRLPSKQAAVIESVVPSGPAANAGLRPWDVVLGFAGAPINGSRHLRQLVRQQAPGAEVNLRVLRASGDQETTFSVKLGSPPPLTGKSPSSVGPVRLDAFGSP